MMPPGGGVVGLLAGMVALAWLVTRPERLRYKMTIEVETAEGMRTGFAVRETVTPSPLPIPMLGEDRGSTSVHGEAVVVDLPGGRQLFALLKRANGSVDHAGRDMLAIFREHEADAKDGVIELWPAMPQTSAPRVNNPLPLLVRFNNLADPKSVEQVDPEVFGVRRVTVETISDAVTEGIGKWLGWLPSQHGSFVRRLSVTDPTNPPIAATLSKSDFSTEIGK